MGSNDYVNCSGQQVLECKECGEHLTLLGLIDDWRSERTNFECRCGETLTLENEEGVVVHKLPRDGLGVPDA